MILLAIDTSGSVPQLALGKGGLILSSVRGEVAQSHHETIAAIVEQCFLDGQTTIRDLDAIVLSEGPGSFTGLRIGFGFAIGIAYARSIPLFLCSTMMMGAWVSRTEREPQIVIRDARRDEVFRQSFLGGCEELTSCEIVKRNELVDGSFTSLDELSCNLAEAALQLACIGKCRPVSLKEATPLYVRVPHAKTIEERGTQIG